MTTSTNKIPANVRVMIAIVASPTLAVLAFLFYSMFLGQWGDITYATGIFSALAFYAYYAVFTGRLLSFRRQRLEQ
ncbi:hypothetical protein QX776_08760 [Alteromonadaceae bacterium BrNp21-10]|nr:hypothetical protein [Alteromonadaceae bacterium BrNp21-10]